LGWYCKNKAVKFCFKEKISSCGAGSSPGDTFMNKGKEAARKRKEAYEASPAFKKD